MSGKSILLVDFSAVFWRQWHASASENLSFAKDRTVELIRAHACSYDYTAVAFDSSDCWRRDLWPEYKATRPAKDEAALEQMRAARAAIALKYPCFRSDRCEADDVIAHLVELMPQWWQATIFTADKDLAQLLTTSRVGPVNMYHLARGELVTADQIEGIFGVGVDKLRDFLALVGDKSDNIPGVAGVGTKRAAELLAKYGDMGGIFDAVRADPEGFTPKLRQSLHEAATREACPINVAYRLVDLSATPCILDRPYEAIQNFQPEPPPTKETMIEEEDLADEAETIEPPKAPQAQPSQPHSPNWNSHAQPAAQPAAQPRALVAPDWSRALEPTDSRTAYGLAKVVVSSRMFSGYGTPEQAMLVIMAGREFGLGAMAALRSFHVVEGKPTMSAQAMMARCLEHPSCKLFRVVRSRCTAELAVVEVQRHGWSEPETYTWGIDDAKRAGLAGRSNWSKYPREMLINRCIAEAARFTWPEVMAGVYAPEDFGGAA